ETVPLAPTRPTSREDLLAVADEILAELDSPQPPAECQPLARVVGTLMRSAPLARNPPLSTGTPSGMGDVDPSPGADATLLSGMWSALEQRETAGLAAGD